MKIRAGFVSNSSSSSFYLKSLDTNTTIDIALGMINDRNEDKDFKWKQEDKANLLLAKQNGLNLEAISFPTCNLEAISFPTCNYDTYIIKWNNMFVIHTCNNHNFDNSLHNYVYADNYQIEVLIQWYGLDDYEDTSIVNKFKFWYPKFDVIGRPSTYDENRKFFGKNYELCKKHQEYDAIWIKDNPKPICLQCAPRGVILSNLKENIIEIPSVIDFRNL